jgi:N-dimethylarginine dimethylaminohydrolase
MRHPAEAAGGLGYEVWGTDLSEFIKAVGAAKCLTLFLD